MYPISALWGDNPTAGHDDLLSLFFERSDADQALPLWADGGLDAQAPDPLAPGGHRWAALPDRVDRLRIDELEPRGLIPWLQERLPTPGQEDCLHALLLSYDAGRNLERLPATAREEPALPHVVWARYPAWIESPGPGCALRWRGEVRAQERLRRWLDDPPDAVSPRPCPSGLESPMGPAEHRVAVEEVLSLIAAGELYQVNIARRLEAPMDPGFTPELYRRLRAQSPPAFGGLWCLGEGTWLASVSPERLLTWSPSRREAHSYPIKGTRPRGGTPEEDDRLARELEADPKERAEHVMIVDLVRNDLGRVAVPGGVEVASLAQVQRLPTVHHLVSDVRAQIREGISLPELLGAVFPGGSITGAPKIAAMRHIERLEGLRRGFYTGSLGLVDGATGEATFNILIRTAVAADGRLLYQTGGGIVADSDPHREWEETRLKAAALERALDSPGN